MYNTHYQNVYLTKDGNYIAFVTIKNAKDNNNPKQVSIGSFKTAHEAFKKMYLIDIGINDICNNHKNVNPKWVLDSVREFLLEHPYTNTDSRLSTWIIKWFEMEGRKKMPKTAEFYATMLSSMMNT
jgi:hypothetical protein